MFRLAYLFVVAVALALPGAGRLPAQSAPLSADRATFFTEPNFQGEALTIEAGASVEDLERLPRPSGRPWAFAISSVRLEGNARAAIFSGPRFGGQRLEVSRDIPDLYAEARSASETWDRAIVSVSVSGPPRTVVTAPVPTPPAPVPVERPPTVVVVPAPQPPPPVVVPRLDRRAAEALVQRAFREVLDRPADPEGLRTYTQRLLHEGWSEQRMIEQLQRSGEARAINPDQAIARMYREVLGREPDPQGLAHYKAKWREGWTQGQIRADLRRSHEARNSHIHLAITRAYRDLLGREPDPGGYANFERLMRDKGWTERDLRASITSSDEYRQKRARK